MIICFECNGDTKGKIDALLRQGGYESVSELVTVAVNNMALIHKEFAQKGLFSLDEKVLGVSPESQPDTGAGGASVAAAPLSGGTELRPATVKGKQPPAKTLDETVPARVPELFTLDGQLERPERLANVPEDASTVDHVITLDRWLFGQFNKILPVKVNCRALARMLQNKPDGVPLKKGAEIAEEAARLGAYLRKLDEECGRGRDDAFATAFPETGPDGQKGRVRYANHFVGSENKAGKVSGMLVGLNLAAPVRDKETRLLLTEAGWEFATLRNPILDGGKEAKLSVEEASFLLAHIARAAPQEAFAYRAILKAVVAGSNTPDKLDTLLSEHAPKDNGKTLSKEFYASQRAGAVSRMCDLGLLTRRREGIRVCYVPSIEGVRFSHG